MSESFQTKNFPTCPGVYLMKDGQGKIIYVGKAKNIRKRVASYLRSQDQLSIKTRVMMDRVKAIDFLCTNTEKEALLLEASLIKKHRPKYNIVLRDDKQYILFKLDKEHPFPALRLTRKVAQDSATYFGPFTSARSARQTLNLINRLFKLRKCSDRAFKNRVRPCLQYHIGRCLAPCCLQVPEEEYGQAVSQVELFLSGKSKELLKSLRGEMYKAAEELNFEKAAEVRDQIRAVQKTIEQQAVALPEGGDFDIFALVTRETGLGIGVLFIRQGRVLDSKNFRFSNFRYWPAFELDQEETEGVLISFLIQFYGPTRFIPDKIVLPVVLKDKSIKKLLTELKGKEVRLVSAKNKKFKQLINMARQNCIEAVDRKKAADLSPGLARIFGLRFEPERIECIDASHLSGQGMRVGMVVFEGGRPKRDEYRVYKFPELEGTSDDYLALAKFVERRVSSGPPWPDLLLIDGGKGQLNAVLTALKRHASEGLFIVAAIAKGPTRRAGELFDQIFVPGRKNPLALSPGSRELLFLQQIRDEAHRFVLSSLRQAGKKNMLKSELENLPSIGPKTARLLWAHFQSLEAIYAASADELARLPGFGPKKARKIFLALQSRVS
ncbi:excinuclease ABC subunit UvrC [Desulfovulcanus sp.]